MASRVLFRAKRLRNGPALLDAWMVHFRMIVRANRFGQIERRHVLD